jgi:hypothetical protein
MIKDIHIKEFQNICKRLNSLIRKIEKYNPEVNYYLSNDVLNLMDGPTHDDSNIMYIVDLPENVACSVRIDKADGGDW